MLKGRKKWRSIVLALFCFLLSGCRKEERISEPVVLTFSWWGDEAVHRATLEAVKEYERLHPNIRIEVDYCDEDNYFERISTMLGNNEAPDLFQFQSTWYERAVRGAMTRPADLTELNVDFTGVEGIIDGYCGVNGEVTLYPLTYSGDCLIINCDFFERHGIAADRMLTWESLLKEGERVHEKKTTDHLLQVSVDEMNQILLPAYLVQLTGENMLLENGKLNMDSHELRETLDTIRLLYESNTIAKSPEEVMVTGKVRESRKWERGKIGICLGTISEYAEMKDKVDFPIAALPLPRIEGSEYSGVNYQAQVGLAVNEKTQYPKEAADFLEWFAGSEEAAEILGLSRGIPANENMRQFLIDRGVITAEILSLEEMLQKDSYMINSKSSDKEFALLRKDALISLLDGKIGSEEAAMQIMTEWVELW